jgi:uncharacterized protein YlzI (FlbEa/FlbD family)
MKTNSNIIAKAALSTTDLTAGLLSPEQSRTFLRQTFEATPLGNLIRHEMRRANAGEIDKIGIASRILRKKTEDTDDGYRAKPTFGKVEYSCTPVRLPWEITEETLRENIEGQSLEATITDLMTRQLGVDLEDLYLNGDTATLETDPDYDFLKINDGWIKQIEAGGHVEDRSAINGGAMSVDVYYDALQQMPNKYNNGTLRWLMSPRRKQEWERYLIDKLITVGGGITDNLINNPAAIPAVPVPALPDDKIILTNPKNLVVVNSYNVIIRKTTEGKEAIMQDKRFYVIHLDFDPIIEELDATVIVKGLAAI